MGRNKTTLGSHPIRGNDHFTLAKKNMGFKAWLNMGIVKLLDIYEDYNLMTFNGIKAKFDVPQKHFFRYLPFRSFILVHLKNSVQQPPFSILETYVLKKKCVKRLFFQF